MGYLQLRRKGRNAYVAEDVDALLAALKLEIADARMEAYEARRMLIVHGPGSMQPAGDATVDLRNGPDPEQAAERDAFDAQIHERRQALAELDEAIATRRRYLHELGQQLIAWAGRPAPSGTAPNGAPATSGDPRWNRTEQFDQQVHDFMHDSDVDTASRAFLGLD